MKGILEGLILAESVSPGFPKLQKPANSRRSSRWPATR